GHGMGGVLPGDAAPDDSVRRRIRPRDAAVPHSVRGTADRVRHLDPSRDGDLGRSREAPVANGPGQPDRERGTEPVSDPALRRKRRGGGYRRRRAGVYGDADCGTASVVVGIAVVAGLISSLSLIAPKNVSAILP